MVTGTSKQVIFIKTIIRKLWRRVDAWLSFHSFLYSSVLQSRYQEVYLWIRQGFVLGNLHVLKSSVRALNKIHLF